MRLLRIAAISLFGTLAVAACVFVRPYEESFLLVTENNVYDFIGPVKVAFTRSTRDCSEVTRLNSSSPEWQVVRAQLGKVGSHSPATPHKILRQGSWYLAQSEFELSEPGIILFEHTANGMVERAEWGGSASPFRDEPVMWGYLAKSAPQAPTSLIKCFEPSYSND
jgi:hypothetical protein